MNISIEEFILLFTKETNSIKKLELLKQKVKNPDTFYQLFVSLIKNNQKQMEENIILNKELTEIFLDADAITYYEIKFSYNFLKNLLLLIDTYQSNNELISMIVFNSLKEKDSQEKILQLPISSKLKIKLMRVFKSEVVSEFLENNIIYPRVEDIHFFLQRGIKVPESFYLNKEFFKKYILSVNLSKMRFNLENIQKIVDVSYFYQLKDRLFESILNSYKSSDDSFKINDKIANYFLKLYYKTYSDSKDISKKLITNLVIDKLFDDNLRNVCLNIKEVLEYDLLVNKLEESHKKLYLKILNIFDLTKEEIIQIYQEYKDNDNKSQLYDDVHLLKTMAYQGVLNSTLKLSEMETLKNKELSDIYQSNIYSLNGEPFCFLVSCLHDIQEDIHDFKRNCYSLISNSNMHVFLPEYLVFGYEEIDASHIMHIYEKDSDSQVMTGETSYVSRIREPNFILSSNKVNEIQIMNTVLDIENKKYKRAKPSYIICFDEINKKSLEASKTLKIPIVLISKKKYFIEEEKENYQKEREEENMYYDNLNKLTSIKEDSFQKRYL